ncbi:MAG TPA: ribokinase [Acidimicrobiia bacterium]|nr:ribokinase [Acidimicrobiia bacterium]
MAGVTVVGSVNLDLVMRVPRLPVAGETVTDGKFSRHPGGKGANQALAARRLGATVSLVAAIGDDEIAESALALLEEAGVDLSRCWVHESLPTGVAVILVDSHGENQIAVAPGANRSLTADALELGSDEAIMCQLEIPIETVQAAAASTTGFFCLNAAPARAVPKEVLKRADLVVVNEVEHATLGVDLSEVRGLVALTLGSAGATLYRHGRAVAKATPPRVEVVDAVGAGDCFVAALTVGLLDGLSADLALHRAVVAGALATTIEGAQASMPTRAEVDARMAQ